MFLICVIVVETPRRINRLRTSMALIGFTGLVVFSRTRLCSYQCTKRNAYKRRSMASRSRTLESRVSEVSWFGCVPIHSCDRWNFVHGADAHLLNLVSMLVCVGRWKGNLGHTRWSGAALFATPVSAHG